MRFRQPLYFICTRWPSSNWQVDNTMLAEKTLKRLLKLEPKSADAYYTLADVELYRHGSGEQAQKFLDKAKKYRGTNERPSDKGLLSSQAWIDARLGPI